MFYKKNPIFNADYSRSATFVVAASGASRRIKAAADYVCDGTADQTEINNAINALGSTGGLVQLSEGTFFLAAPVVVKSDITLQGMGGGTILNQNTAATDGIQLQKSNVRMGVHNLRIQGGSALTDAVPGGSAILIKNNRQCFVRNIWVDGVTPTDDRWKFGIDINDDAGSTPSRHILVDGFNIESISSAADSTGIRLRVGPGGWGFYFNNGTVQTQADASDNAYSTRGKNGIWIQGCDGVHFDNIEAINFDINLLMDTTDAVSGSLGNSNWRFNSCSFECEGATNGYGAYVKALCGTGRFTDCTFFGGVGTNAIGCYIDLDVNGLVNQLLFDGCHFAGNAASLKLDNTSNGVLMGPWVFDRCLVASNFSIASDVNMLRVTFSDCFTDQANFARFPFSTDQPMGRMISLRDEFAGGEFVTGRLGELGWQFDSPAGATIGREINLGTGRVGAVVRGTGVTSTTRTRLYLPNPLTYSIIPLFDPHDWFEVSFILKFLSTANVRTRLGIFQIAVPGASTDDPPAQGIYFEHLDTDTNWFAVCRKDDTQTRTNTNKAMDTSFHKFTIRRKKPGDTSAGTIQFVIDDDETNAIDISTNLPVFTAGGVMVFIVNTTGVTKEFTIDTFDLRVIPNSRY